MAAALALPDFRPPRPSGVGGAGGGGSGPLRDVAACGAAVARGEAVGAERGLGGRLGGAGWRGLGLGLGADGRGARALGGGRAAGAAGGHGAALVGQHRLCQRRAAHRAHAAVGRAPGRRRGQGGCEPPSAAWKAPPAAAGGGSRVPAGLASAGGSDSNCSRVAAWLLAISSQYLLGKKFLSSPFPLLHSAFQKPGARLYLGRGLHERPYGEVLSPSLALQVSGAALKAGSFPGGGRGGQRSQHFGQASLSAVPGLAAATPRWSMDLKSAGFSIILDF